MIGVIWFGGLGYRSLAEPDEGRYAEIPREMVASGDFVTPRLNGIKYFEKPALQYWATAMLYKLFGINQWAARLWPALTGFLGALFVWLMLRARMGDTVATTASLFVLTSPYYAFFSQVLTLDIGVSVFISAGMLLFMRAQGAQSNSAMQRNAMLLGWACLALAVLSKGLIGLVLPALVVGVYVLVERDFSVLRRMHWVSGLLIFGLIAVPWFIVVSQRNPEFAEFFFIHEHFARYTSNIHRKVEPFWFFIPIVLVGTLPWTWLALEGLRAGWQRPPDATGFRTERFLVLWVLCTVVFFSVSGSKLHGYVLPAVVPLAILAAQRAASLAPRALLIRVVPALVLLGVLGFVGGEIMQVAQENSPAYFLHVRYARWIQCAGVAILSVASLVALMSRGTRSLGVMCFATLLLTQACVLGFENVAPLRSAKFAAQTIRSHLTAGSRVFQVGRYDHGLSFYLGATSTIADVGGELDFGIQQEPHLALPSAEAFELAWNNAPSAIAVMSPASFDKYSARGLAFEVLSKDTKRVVARRAW